jgi:hypothetical protein
LAAANELLEYWSDHPPVHVLLAGMMRSRPLRKSRSSQDLITAIATVGGSVSTRPSVQMKSLLKSEHEGHEGDT